MFLYIHTYPFLLFLDYIVTDKQKFYQSESILNWVIKQVQLLVRLEKSKEVRSPILRSEIGICALKLGPETGVQQASGPNRP